MLKNNIREVRIDFNLQMKMAKKRGIDVGVFFL